MMSLFNLSDYNAIKSPLLNGRYISSEMLNDVLLELNKSASVEINEIGNRLKKNQFLSLNWFWTNKNIFLVSNAR